MKTSRSTAGYSTTTPTRHVFLSVGVWPGFSKVTFSLVCTSVKIQAEFPSCSSMFGTWTTAALWATWASCAVFELLEKGGPSRGLHLNVKKKDLVITSRR